MPVFGCKIILCKGIGASQLRTTSGASPISLGTQNGLKLPWSTCKLLCYCRNENYLSRLQRISLLSVSLPRLLVC